MRAIIEGDFKGNFYNACGCNDTGLQQDLVLNEISNLIIEKPIMVIATLYESGYKFVGKTRKQLARAVAEALAQSPAFQAKLGTLIAINNGLVGYDDVKGYAVADTGNLNNSYNNVIGGAAASQISGAAAAGGGNASVLGGNVASQIGFGGGGDAFGGGGGAMAGGGDMMGMIGQVIGAIGNITQGGLMFGAAKKGADAAKATAAASLEQTRIASEANLRAQKEQTRQEMLKALGLKSQAGQTNWAAIFGVFVLLLIAGGVGFWLVRKQAGGVSGGVTPAPVPQKADGGSMAAPVVQQPATQNQQIAAVAANLGLAPAAPVAAPAVQTAPAVNPAPPTV